MLLNKILIVSDYLFKEVNGGSARVSTELSYGLSKKYEIILFLRGLKINKEIETYKNLKIYRTFLNPYKIFKYLNYIFKNEKPDIINFHDPLLSFFIVLYIKIKGIKIKSVYFFHSPIQEEYKIRALKKNFSNIRIFLGFNIRRKIEKFVLNNSDKILVASSFMKEKLLKIHNKEGEILSLGVNLNSFYILKEEEINKIKENLKIDKSKIIFFTLRNLEPRMGLENLLKAISLIENKENLLFFIAGTGAMAKNLIKICKELKINDFVKFLGRIKDEYLNDYYNISNAFILPTEFLEGFGLVSIEAMAVGNLVLATPIGANKEIVGSFKENILFQSEKPIDIKKGIEEFLIKYNKEDINLKLKLREFIKNNYSLEIYVQKMENVFLNLKEK